MPNTWMSDGLLKPFPASYEHIQFYLQRRRTARHSCTLVTVERPTDAAYGDRNGPWREGWGGRAGEGKGVGRAHMGATRSRARGEYGDRGGHG